MSDCIYQCAQCPAITPGEVSRPAQAEIAVVYDSPSAEDVQKDELLSGAHGMLVKAVLEGYGLSEGDYYVTTALNCRPDLTKDALLVKSMKACRWRLKKELREAGVKKVLCVGPLAYGALTDAEKKVPITKVRGKWHTVTDDHGHEMQIIGTVPVKFMMGLPDYYRDFERDVAKFCTTNGPASYPEVELWVCETYEEWQEAFVQLKDEPYLGMDVETTGFSTMREEMLAYGFFAPNDDRTSGTCVVIPEHLITVAEVWDDIGALINSPDVACVFHNAKFDMQWTRRYMLENRVEYAPQNIQDTMLLSYVCDERPVGQGGVHSLKTLARTLYDAPDYDIEMGKWLDTWKRTDLDAEKREEMRRDMHQYLALDCYYTTCLYPHLYNTALEEDEDLLEYYDNLLIPGTLAFVDIEMHGAKLDLDFFRASKDNLDVRIAQSLERLRSMTGKDDLNPGSPKQIADVLYVDMGLPVLKTSRRGKQQGGKTSKEVLSKLKRDPRYKDNKDVTDLIEEILLYRTLTKTRGTYIVGLLERVDHDGRIRGSFNMGGTATGRISASNPNLQNIPDASHTKIEVRNGYVAPEGMVLIEADYSQLELRVAAHVSGCEAFKEVFVEDRDVHQEVTWALFKKTKAQATKYERYMAKCMNFGVMYMRGADSLANGPEMDYIEDGGNRRWTKPEVQSFFDKMLDNWPGFRDWIQRAQREVYETQYIKLPMGNRRRYPFIPPNDRGATGRQAVNTPIQGTAGQMTVWAIIQLHKELPHGAHIVTTVHDSIQVECPVDLVDEVKDLMQDIMTNRLPFDMDVPIKADADVAQRWGEMGKFEWDSDQQVLALVSDEE